VSGGPGAHTPRSGRRLLRPIAASAGRRPDRWRRIAAHSTATRRAEHLLRAGKAPRGGWSRLLSTATHVRKAPHIDGLAESPSLHSHRCHRLHCSSNCTQAARGQLRPLPVRVRLPPRWPAVRAGGVTPHHSPDHHGMQPAAYHVPSGHGAVLPRRRPQARRQPEHSGRRIEVITWSIVSSGLRCWLQRCLH
jgi:hypothetical protein